MHTRLADSNWSFIFILFQTAMANHGANKNKRKYAQAPAEDRYDSLEVHEGEMPP
jgi:hypothetical protein